MASVIPSDSSVYYQGNYWNDIPEVQEYINQRVSGDPAKVWYLDFKKRYAAKPFKHALSVCCGKGWLERDFIDQNIVKKITAFDFGPELLAEADKAKGDRPIKFFQADANLMQLPVDEYDLIINYAALHHIQYLNRFLCMLAKSLKPGGILVNYDYIGPRRNQYGFKQWCHIMLENSKLPDFFRHKSLRYPHLPTMLATDPTEAIHSDAIIPTMERYFKIIDRTDINGGLAYMLLTHNPAIPSIKPKMRKKLVTQILQRDNELTDNGQVPPLFSYFIAQPNKKILKDSAQIKAYQQEENAREQYATEHLGCYTWHEYLLVKANPFIYTLYRLGIRVKQRVKRLVA